MSIKTIDYWRHGDNLIDPDPTAGMWQKESPLMEEGKMPLLEISARHLNEKPYDLHVTSGFRRARETAHLIVPKAIWQNYVGLEPKRYREFDKVLATIPQDKWPKNLQEWEVLCPGMLDEEQDWAVGGIKKMLEFIAGGESLIAVSHQPLVDLVRAHFEPAFPKHTQVLGKGELYRMKFSEDNEFISLSHLK